MCTSGNYPNLKGWGNSALGVSGASFPGTATIPTSCIAATPTACKSALTAAGFSVTPTEVTLSTSGADLTKPAGAVVTTSPAAGSVVDTATAITLSENPNPLPVVILTP